MRIAILTTDNRSHHQRFDRDTPEIGPAPEALLSGFAELPEVEVHVITCTRQPLRSPAKLADNIFFHSLTVPKWGWMRTGYWGCIRAVRRKLREIRPDLVHGQGTELEAGLAAAFSGHPNVITLLGIMREMAALMRARPGSFYWLAARLESLALRRTAGVLANSRFTEERVRSCAAKTWRVPNALRRSFFDVPLPVREGTHSAGRQVVMNIGTIVDYKRQNELLDAAEQLRAAGTDLEWHFIGAANPGVPYAARFMDRVRSLPWVKWENSVSLPEIIQRLDRASALVHVSRIESFGLVVAEALARNLKFLGFGSSGVADIVEGVDGAESFADGDWNGLQRALVNWLKMGCPQPATASQIMRERYHPRVIAMQHLAIYQEVLRQEVRAYKQ